MTTFTLKEYLENKMIQEKDGSVTVNLEPIPFAGMVAILDSEERIETLKHQMNILQESYDSLNQSHTELFSIFCDIAVLLKQKYPTAYDELNAIIGTHDLLKKLMQDK